RSTAVQEEGQFFRRQKPDGGGTVENLCDDRPVGEQHHGDAVYVLLILAVMLFAYGTIIAQIFYGTSAIRFLTTKKLPLFLYGCASAGCTVVGAVVSAPVLWTFADILIGGMTVVNCMVLILLRKSLRD
ncbi:MAG: sodium:alanine symporter family protein, partial [Clostridia bacterium]|nr:sodium:alanine symporter family protein [Clostridia bacterium]